jgi:hypothetical protein
LKKEMLVAVALGVAAVCGCATFDGTERAPTKRQANIPMGQENYTIQLRGTYADCPSLDLTLTGSGPEFKTSLPNPKVVFSATLKPNADRMEIVYSLAFEVRVTNGIQRVTGPDKQEREVPVIEARMSGAQGTVIVANGKPVAIVTQNQRKLELTVTKSNATSLEKR